MYIFCLFSLNQSRFISSVCEQCAALPHVCGCVTERLVCRSVQSLSLAVVYLETNTILVSVNGENVTEDGFTDYL